MAAALGAPEARRSEALRVLRGEVAATPSPRSEGPLLLGMGAAARYLGVSRPTMWRMIRDGRLEKVEVLAGSFRMRRGDLDAYVAGNGVKGIGEHGGDQRSEDRGQGEDPQNDFARRECAGDVNARKSESRS